MIVGWIDALRRNMKTLKRVLIGFLVLVGAFDAILPRDEAHAHYLIDKIPVYWAAFGFVGCFILIKVGKGIAHAFLSKNEDYYG
jgi:hypothetical protein